MITRSYGLDEINDAFVDMREGKLKRGVVVFDEELAGLSARDDTVAAAA
jgi:alcohol dehydrogenase/S-(hydroxymethyl)glutathione dehydrogenase/alcohol dehydrogenase